MSIPYSIMVGRALTDLLMYAISIRNTGAEGMPPGVNISRFPLDVCKCGKSLSDDETICMGDEAWLRDSLAWGNVPGFAPVAFGVGKCWMCTLQGCRANVDYFKTASKICQNVCQVSYELQLLHMLLPMHVPMTGRAIRVARQRWRLTLLLEGKPDGFMPRIAEIFESMDNDDIVYHRRCPWPGPWPGRGLDCLIDFVYHRPCPWPGLRRTWPASADLSVAVSAWSAENGCFALECSDWPFRPGVQ